MQVPASMIRLLEFGCNLSEAATNANLSLPKESNDSYLIVNGSFRDEEKLKNLIFLLEIKLSILIFETFDTIQYFIS